MWCGWSRALSPRLRERGRRTPLQEDRNWCKLITISVYTVGPSYMRFRLITKDLGRFREMPSFALSRRQRGFESRWGHKIKPALTRPDTTASQSASPRVDRQGRARDARTPTGAAFGTLQISRLRLPKPRVPELRGREVGPRLGPQGALQRRASTLKGHYGPEGLPDMSVTTKHVRSALRTRDVDRSSRSLAASRTSLSSQNRRRNDQRA
jgi:hypothetical protein